MDIEKYKIIMGTDLFKIQILLFINEFMIYNNFMKKIPLLFLITFLCSAAFADKIQQAFDINGQTVYKCVELSYEISFQYNSNGKLIKETSSDGPSTSYEYNAKGNLVKRTTPGDLIETFEYDSTGKMTSSERAVGPSFYIISYWYEYDYNGRLIYEKEDNPKNPCIIEYTYMYDSKNNMICKSSKMTSYDTEENSEAETIWYEYDTKGKLIHEKSQNNETWYDYDSKGNLVHEKDSNGYETWYYNIYNSKNQIIKQSIYYSD